MKLLKTVSSRLLLLALIISLASLFSAAGQELKPDLLKNLKWRQIGPASFGGRIDDIEAVPDNPNIIFIATASGGIFKSVNNGVTWKPVFDEEGTSLSIGDIAIAPSDPNVVWAGTGEANSRQSSSWGDGIYKSLDGGETWKYMGLKETHHIGRIVINPKNPDVVFAAALGHLWGSNTDRGLYRTRDGGKTWEKVLWINDVTGVVDVAMEANGRVLYAAAYQKMRKAWGFVGGGPQSGLYRSLDGGDTWEKLSQGLPEGDTGRIGIDISKSQPNFVYVILENKNGGVFKSEDRGETWTRMNSIDPRPMYYSNIRVDPVNPHKIWMLDSPLFLSIDGGKTLSSQSTGENIHVDHHAFWINPRNPDHLMLGGDGGFYISYDGSKNWDFIDNLPIGQYYGIAVDTRDPYWIYGGTQDNGSWGIPSRTASPFGITNADVVNIAYGDGFYSAVDPKDHRAIFAESQMGRLYFVDLLTREEKGIKPVPQDPKKEYRWNWSCPLLISAHDSNVFFYGGNILFKTSDRGQTWTEISPDLTRNQDWKKIPIMGVVRNDSTLSRDDGVSHYGTLTSVSESPLQAGLIYAGTDDGNLQMTMDGGQTWTNLTDRFKLPGPRWVTDVVASAHGAGTAYATFDGHYDDDFKPYIYKTADFGKTWKSVAGDLPDGMTLNVIAEHPRNANLLFAGTEFGLFISVNGGKNWVLPGGNLPRVPVDDIVVNARDNDLILGTHGRSIIILDDIAFLEKLDESAINSEAGFFPMREAVEFYETRILPSPGASKFAGPNPDYGASITYYLKADPPKPDKPAADKEKSEKSGEKPKEEKAPTVKILILDGEGRTVRELEGPDRKGFNRISWDLRYPLPFKSEGEEGWFGPIKGRLVLPGEYTAKLVARNQEFSRKFNVRIDPLARTSPDGLKSRFDLSLKYTEFMRLFKDSQKAAESLDKELKRIKDVIKDLKDVPEEVKKKLEDFSKKLEEKKKYFGGSWDSPGFDIMDYYGQLQASTSAPTEAQVRKAGHIEPELKKNIEGLNALITKDLPELQSLLAAKGIKLVPVEAVKM